MSEHQIDLQNLRELLDAGLMGSGWEKRQHKKERLRWKTHVREFGPDGRGICIKLVWSKQGHVRQGVVHNFTAHRCPILVGMQQPL